MLGTHRQHLALLASACLALGACNIADEPSGPGDPGGGNGNGNGNGQNHPPVSRIVLQLTAQVDENVDIQNVATDPDGDAITAYRFKTPLQDVTQSSPRFTVSFADTGLKVVSVLAKDSKNVWSTESSASIRINARPVQPRLLFADDGSQQPIDLGYTIGYPNSGVAALTITNGVRKTVHDGGGGSFTYGRHDWFNVPRNAHIHFRARFTVEILEPIYATTADDYGYSWIEFQFGHDGTSFGANYFVLARNDLYSDGFIGAPPKLEQYFTPGKHVFDRVGNGTWVDIDIDLDRLLTTRFNHSVVNVSQFNQIVWSIGTRDVRGRGDEYRKTCELDFFEIYVPEPAQ